MQITPVNYNYLNQKVQKNNQPSFGELGKGLGAMVEKQAKQIKILEDANELLTKKLTALEEKLENLKREVRCPW